MLTINFQRIFILISCALSGWNLLTAQTEVPLKNPSFEDTPRAGGGNYTFKVPLEKPVLLPIKDWFDFRSIYFPMHTPPDIHGAETYFWNVTTRPYHGESFLGLVTRPNRSYEGVSQQLEIPLHAGKRYLMKVYLCHDIGYTSPLQKPGAREAVATRFDTPVVLRIGGSNSTGVGEILSQSDPIDHPEWREYIFDLSPTETFRFIYIEAYFANDQEPVAGNVLVDHMKLVLIE